MKRNSFLLRLLASLVPLRIPWFPAERPSVGVCPPRALRGCTARRRSARLGGYTYEEAVRGISGRST